MSRSLPSVKEASWRQIVDEYASSGQSAKDFCQLRAISLRMFYFWRRKIALNDQGSGPLNRQRKDDHRELAIVPLKVITEPGTFNATQALGSHRTAPSVRISLTNKIVVEIFADAQP